MFKNIFCYIAILFSFTPFHAFAESPAPFDAGVNTYLWSHTYAQKYCPSVCSDMVWKEGTFEKGAAGQSNTCGVYSTDSVAASTTYTIPTGNAPASYCAANSPVVGMFWTNNWFCYQSGCVCNCQPPEYSLGDQCFKAKAAGAVSACFNINQNYYGVTVSPDTWQNTQKLAQQYNGNLVTINSTQENTFILENLAVKYDVWIGLNDLQTVADWVWIDGQTEQPYLNWGQGEPNNKGSENCAQLYASGGRPKETAGQWNNLPCTSHLTGVIEWK